MRIDATLPMPSPAVLAELADVLRLAERAFATLRKDLINELYDRAAVAVDRREVHDWLRELDAYHFPSEHEPTAHLPVDRSPPGQLG